MLARRPTEGRCPFHTRHGSRHAFIQGGPHMSEDSLASWPGPRGAPVRAARGPPWMNAIAFGFGLKRRHHGDGCTGLGLIVFADRPIEVIDQEFVDDGVVGGREGEFPLVIGNAFHGDAAVPS